MYNKKSPYYIQEEETAKEKKEVKEYIDEVNKKIEAKKKTEQEIEIVIRRVRLSRQIRETKLKQKQYKKTRKLERKAC